MFHPGTQDRPQAAYGERPFQQAAPSPREVVLQTIGLTKAYGKRLAVNNLNLEVVRGEVFGFLGPNGAGKTTTIRMLLGLVRPTAGTAEVLGRDVGTHGADVL